MAFIPGATINGKFKPYCQMTTEELEELVIKQRIISGLVASGAGFIVGLAIIVFGG